MHNEKYFETRYTPDARRTIVWKEIVSFLSERYIPSRRDTAVIDIGAGYCDFINNVNPADGEEGRSTIIRTAVDIDEKIRRYAGPGVEVVIADCSDLCQIPSDKYDVCFSSNLLEHLEPDKILKTTGEMRRILKKDGRIILLLPNYRYCMEEFWDDYTHRFPLTDISIKDILSASGFYVEKVYPKFLPFSFKEKKSLYILVNRFIVKFYIWSPWKPFAGQMLAIGRKK